LTADQVGNYVYYNPGQNDYNNTNNGINNRALAFFSLFFVASSVAVG
jgi:hypothetical protein